MLAAHLRAVPIISSTPYRLIVIIEFIAHGSFNHAHLRLVLHIFHLVEILPRGLELSPIHASLLQMFDSVFQHLLLLD